MLPSPPGPLAAQSRFGHAKRAVCGFMDTVPSSTERIVPVNPFSFKLGQDVTKSATTVK
jgi:hypothetical protein